MAGQHRVADLRVDAFEPILPPRALRDEYPLPPQAAEVVVQGRDQVRRALAGEDRRLLVIVGPCSVHDPRAAREYASRLAALQGELGHHLQIIMRVYFEKPRTTVGWKGMINDPHLD